MGVNMIGRGVTSPWPGTTCGHGSDAGRRGSAGDGIGAERAGRHRLAEMDDRAVAANEGLRPWPRLRDTWWVFGLAAAALALFLLGFLVALRCGPWGCRGSLVARL